MGSKVTTVELGPPAAPARAPWNLRGSFAASLAAISIVLLVLIAVFTEYEDELSTNAEIDKYYPFFLSGALACQWQGTATRCQCNAQLTAHCLYDRSFCNDFYWICFPHDVPAQIFIFGR